MIRFKQYLSEASKFKGTFCYHKENHYLSTEAASQDEAFKKMCFGLSKKLGRSVESYFRRTPDSYNIKEIK